MGKGWGKPTIFLMRRFDLKSEYKFHKALLSVLSLSAGRLIARIDFNEYLLTFNSIAFIHEGIDVQRYAVGLPY